MRKRIFAIGAALAVTAGCTGCNEAVQVWKPLSDNTIKIAVVGDEDYIVNDGNFMNSIELASDDFREKTGVKIEAVIYDDGADYNLAISRSKEIAGDDTIAAVLVMQELDFIDATAEIFNEAKKPFILIDGCYESIIDKNYEYMLVDCINAKFAGKLMADYVAEQKYSKVAFCHSNTEYEEDELKGFQKNLSKDVRLVDTFVGPYSQEEFDVAYSRWTALDVEAVCVSNYDILNSELVSLLREKGSDIAVISDYVMDSSKDIELNGKYLDGTAIVGRYIKGEVDSEISSRFKEKYGYEMTETDIQGYDIVTVIGNELNSGISESIELIDNMKSSEGYNGISGTLKFDENGCLEPQGNEILIFRNGMFS